jgi:flagellar biosynthesis protein FlhB
MKSNTVYGIYVVLVSLLLMFGYAGYWIVLDSLNKILRATADVSIYASYWVNLVFYVMFWIGVVLFFVGVAMVVVGVILDAMEVKVKYASLKRAQA